MTTMDTGLLPAFCAVTGPEPFDAPGRLLDTAVRTRVRALSGMLKEALVTSTGGRTWRLISDEGPYLAGTDTAPSPLGFFVTGATASVLDAVCAAAADRDIDLPNLEVVVDSYYSMDGSALRGTMVGGAMAPDIQVRADVSREFLDEVVPDAVEASLYAGILRGTQLGLFTLVHNGTAQPVARVPALSSPPMPDPARRFHDLRPADYESDLMVRAAEGDGSGAGGSLQAEQSRRLHVRGVGRLRADGVRVIDQYLFSPVGSQFRLLADDEGRAPDAATYLSAGLGFCFMTQLGRYAKIVKSRLQSYQIIQDTHLGPGIALPIETHVYLQLPDPVESAQLMVDIGEQTCFLHAAARTDLQPTLTVGDS